MAQVVPHKEAKAAADDLEDQQGVAELALVGRAKQIEPEVDQSVVLVNGFKLVVLVVELR